MNMIKVFLKGSGIADDLRVIHAGWNFKWNTPFIIILLYASPHRKYRNLKQCFPPRNQPCALLYSIPNVFSTTVPFYWGPKALMSRDYQKNLIVWTQLRRLNPLSLLERQTSRYMCAVSLKIFTLLLLCLVVMK